jgi:RNA polymerase sigma-70 factor (ECF subfamily)
VALRADDVDLTRDSNLVVRFQSGDGAAFDDLYRRYFSRLHRYCQRRVGDPHEAEEIAQEAFTRALRAMPTFAGERRFYPWMTVIASRLCVDSHRRRGRATPVAELDPGTVEADLSELFDEVDHDHLRVAMDRLAPRHREVLDLRERHGWSYQRIADSYSVSIGTVEALLHRARRALRREYLQVAGDTPRWAAIPGLGWAGRRLLALRLRAAEHAPAWSDATTPFMAKVASVAVASVAVAGVAGLGHVGSAGHASTARAAAERVEVRMDVRPAVAAIRAAADDLDVSTAPAFTERAVAPNGWRGVTSADGGDAAGAQPFTVQVVDGVGVGVNPQEIVADLTNGTPSVPLVRR